jgi:hypothetical protein
VTADSKKYKSRKIKYALSNSHGETTGHHNETQIGTVVKGKKDCEQGPAENILLETAEFRMLDFLFWILTFPLFDVELTNPTHMYIRLDSGHFPSQRRLSIVVILEIRPGALIS